MTEYVTDSMLWSLVGLAIGYVLGRTTEAAARSKRQERNDQ